MTICVATNWVTVSGCFVVGCRDDVYYYKLGHCWQPLCRGLQKMGITPNWDIVNNSNGLQRWQCILLPCQQLLHGELQRWGCALLWTVSLQWSERRICMLQLRETLYSCSGGKSAIPLYIHGCQLTIHREREKAASVDTVLSSKEQFRTGKCVPASWGMCNMSGCTFIYFLNNKIEGTF